MQLDRIQYIHASRQPRKPRKPPVLEAPLSLLPGEVTASRRALVGSRNHTFIAAACFNGKVKGFVFKKGESGTGYYQDQDNQAVARASNQMLIEDAFGAGSFATLAHVHENRSAERRPTNDAQMSASQVSNQMQGMETESVTAQDGGQEEEEGGNMADSSEAEQRFLTRQQKEDDSLQSDAEQPTGVFTVFDVGIRSGSATLEHRNVLAIKVSAEKFKPQTREFQGSELNSNRKLFCLISKCRAIHCYVFILLYMKEEHVAIVLYWALLALLAYPVKELKTQRRTDCAHKRVEIH